MSNRGLITKAWLTSFGDFLTLLLCAVVASYGASIGNLTTYNNSINSDSNQTKSNIIGAGIGVASSKQLAVLRAGFFDNAEDQREVHDQLIGLAKSLPTGSIVDIELCGGESEEILQRGEILQGIFTRQRLRMFPTKKCSELSGVSVSQEAVATVMLQSLGREEV